jgi:mono/diheme cytochrome c family protein
MLQRLGLLALAAGLAAPACYHFAPRRAEASAPKLYAERCSTCHGPTGRGDGLGGQSLDPKPRDFASRVAGVGQRRTNRATIRGRRRDGPEPLMPAARLVPAQLQTRRLRASPRDLSLRLSIRS